MLSFLSGGDSVDVSKVLNVSNIWELPEWPNLINKTPPSFDPNVLKDRQAVLVVNTATKCGLTKNHFQKLGELYDKYGSRGFEILAFPSNDFHQESADVCTRQKHMEDLKFYIFDTIHVNGPKQHSIFKWLKTRCDEFHSGSTAAADKMKLGSIGWNFGKFLVTREGVKYFGPKKDPTTMIPDIEAALNN